MMAEAIRRGTQGLGSEHPLTLIGNFHQGSIYLRQGQGALAQDIWTSILEKMESVLGVEHECTVNCKRYLDLMEGKLA